MEDIAALAVSPAKAADLLGISRSKFYELLNEEIPAFKVGRRTLVRVADIERFLNSLSKSER
jgi:excisionase family DNA binding protein